MRLSYRNRSSVLLCKIFMTGVRCSAKSIEYIYIMGISEEMSEHFGSIFMWHRMMSTRLMPSMNRGNKNWKCFKQKTYYKRRGVTFFADISISNWNRFWNGMEFVSKVSRVPNSTFNIYNFVLPLKKDFGTTLKSCKIGEVINILHQ